MAPTARAGPRDGPRLADAAEARRGGAVRPGARGPLVRASRGLPGLVGPPTAARTAPRAAGNLRMTDPYRSQIILTEAEVDLLVALLELVQPDDDPLCAPRDALLARLRICRAMRHPNQHRPTIGED